jgi:tripartite motif-containing protein 71
MVVGERGTGRGQFENPRRLAVDNVGYVYVYDSDSHRIQVFDESGDYQTQWPLEGPVLSMLADRDRRLYILGTELIRYDGSTGREIDRISVTTPVGRVSRFEAMALTSQGNLVLSFWDHNAWIDYLLLADDSGQLIEAWEGAVTTPYGKDGIAKLIAVDRQGTIYAYELETILKFGPGGRFTNRVGARGSGPGEWSAPRNIAVDQSGRLYVGEWRGIHVYDTNARFLDTIPTDNYVMDLAISDNNDIWAIVEKQLVRFELLNR